MKQTLFLTIKTWREGKHFIAYNPELDVASQGKTALEAQEHLSEALELFAETAKQRGTLREILQETGLAMESNQQGYQPPHISFTTLEVVS